MCSSVRKAFFFYTRRNLGSLLVLGAPPPPPFGLVAFSIEDFLTALLGDFYNRCEEVCEEDLILVFFNPFDIFF